MCSRQPIVILNFQHDGQSNVLELSVNDTIDEETEKQCVAGFRKFARNINKNRDASGRNISNCVAKSTDFVCSHPDCTYVNKLESRLILHTRSHLAFEVSPDAMSGTVMRFDRNCLKYTCSNCPRVTADKTCFREHLRHHLFQRPYSCSVCTLPLHSITQLRVHFQKVHPKQQTDMVFSETDFSGILDNVVELFNPDAKPHDTPLKLAIIDKSTIAKLSPVIQDLPIAYLSTRSSKSDASKVQPSSDSNVLKPTVERCETVKSAGSLGGMLFRANKLPTPGATCSFINGVYSCNNCRYTTALKETFATHVWKHIHNAWGSNCKHNSGDGNEAKNCLVLDGLTEILSNIATTKVCEQLRSSIKSKVVPDHMGLKLVADTKSDTDVVAGVKSNHSSSLKVIGTILHMDQKDSTCARSLDAFENNGAGGKMPHLRDSRHNNQEASHLIEDDGSMFTIYQETAPLSQRCYWCSYTCDTDKQMSSHNASCHVAQRKQRFNCKHCNFATGKLQTLLWHVAHHKGENKISYQKCISCNFSTMLISEMKNHESTSHAGSKNSIVSVSEKVTYLQNIIKCPVCSVALLWGDIFQNHIRKRHMLNSLSVYLKENYPEDIYPYNVCPAVLKFPKNLLSAVSDRTSTEVETSGSATNCNASEIFKFHCDSCDFSTNDCVMFADHKLAHEMDCSTNLKCLSCAFIAITDAEYQSHVKDHDKYDDITYGFSCALCFFKHPQQRCVTDHVNKFHSGNSELVISLGSRKKAVPKCKKKKSSGKKKSKSKINKARKNISSDFSTGNESPHSTRSSISLSGSSLCTESVETQSILSPLDNFENNLPKSQVFSQDMKCPECSFSNRFRVNLIRHIRMHRERAKDVAVSDKISSSQLSYSLWEHPASEKNVKTSCARLSKELYDKKDCGVTEDEVALDKIGVKSLTGENDKTLEAERANLKIDGTQSSLPPDCSKVSFITNVSHVVPKYFACEKCENKYVSEADLERHFHQCHEGPYVCHICGMLILLESSVRKHYNTEHCGTPARFEVSLWQNLASEKNGSDVCARVRRISKDKKDFAEDEVELDELAIDKLAVENKTIETTNYKVRIEEVQKSKSLDCSTISDVTGLQSKDSPGVPPKYFACEKCEDKYISEVDLERHIAKYHEGPYICHICGTLMLLESTMRKHYATEHCGAPVRFEVLRGQNIEKCGGTDHKKKIARIQGVLRGEELLGETTVNEPYQSRRPQQTTLHSLYDDVHSVLAFDDCLQSAEVVAVTPELSNISDCRSMEDHSNSSAPVTVSSLSSLPANPTDTVRNDSCYIGPQEFVGSSSTGSEHALPGNFGMTTDVPTLRPSASTITSEPVDTSLSANAFVSCLRSGVESLPFLGMAPTNMPHPILPSVWPTNFPPNVMSSLGSINMDALKSMLAAHLVPVLAGMMSNPSMVSGLLRMLGPTLPNSGVTPQVAAMFSQYLSSMIPSSIPVNQVNLSHDTGSADVNAWGDRPVQSVVQSTVAPTAVVADRPNMTPSVSLTSPSSASVDGSSNSLLAAVTTVKKSCSTSINSGVTCNLIPLSNHVDLTSLPLRRHYSPAPSPVSIASDDAHSGSDMFADSDSDPDSARGRKRIRCSKTFSVRSSSVASSVSSRRSNCSSLRRKKRRKLSINEIEPNNIRFTCHRCPYSTACRNKFSKHIQREFSIDGIPDMSIGEGHHPLLNDSPESRVRQRCCYCAFSTFLSDEFSQHMKTHTVIKRYRCIYCSFAGYSSKEVKRHVSSAHPERPFAINRERQPTYRRDVRTVDFNPTVRLADVMKMSHRSVRRLMAQNDIDSIDL